MIRVVMVMMIRVVAVMMMIFFPVYLAFNLLQCCVEAGWPGVH